jgi:hypothetical protein
LTVDWCGAAGAFVPFLGAKVELAARGLHPHGGVLGPDVVGPLVGAEWLGVRRVAGTVDLQGGGGVGLGSTTTKIIYSVGW